MEDKKELGSARFLTFASQTIAFETGGDKSGAYHNDPNDAGGETKWGISKRAHPNENIRALTYNDALRIYQTQYWNPLYDYISDVRLAYKLYDMGVLSGTRTTVKQLQKVLRKSGITLKVDGIFGNMTLAATNIYTDQNLLYDKYIAIFEDYFKWSTMLRPKNKRFLKGWMRRLSWVWGGTNEQW